MEPISIKSIRYKIMTIAFIGGFGFLCYLLINYWVARDNESRIAAIRSVNIPLIERMDSAQTQLAYVKDILAKAISLEDVEVIEDADVKVREVERLFAEIVEIEPGLRDDIDSLTDLLQRYYQQAHSLSNKLAENSEQLDLYHDSAIRVNQSYLRLERRLSQVRGHNYSIYLSRLQTTSEKMDNGIILGVALGVITIVVLLILAWTIAARVTEAVRRSDQLKDEFLATISHELRTPMNGVTGSLELIEMAGNQGDIHDYVETAASSAADMMVLIDNLLDFSEVQSGRLKARTKRFTLSLQLALLTHIYQTKCEAKNLEFLYELDGVFGEVLDGEIQRTMYVLNRLLDNAVKFTNDGYVEFEVGYKPHPMSPDRCFIQFVISDTGVGIGRHYQGEIFTPFKQADGSFSRKHGGLGIGLSICKKLVDYIEGELTFTSVEGVGSTFYLSVPFRLADYDVMETPLEQGDYLSPLAPVQPLEPETLAVDVASVVSTPTLVNCAEVAPLSACQAEATILVVEDNAVNQMVLKGMLKKLGYAVITANNGQLAVQIYQDKGADLILMDCQMPVMDGLEATRKIRVLEGEQGGVPIIAVTANVMEGDRERCLEAGMDDYIKKPIDKATIEHKLMHYLRKHNEGSASVAV